MYTTAMHVTDKLALYHSTPLELAILALWHNPTQQTRSLDRWSLPTHEVPRFAGVAMFQLIRIHQLAAKAGKKHG